MTCDEPVTWPAALTKRYLLAVLGVVVSVRDKHARSVSHLVRAKDLAKC